MLQDSRFPYETPEGIQIFLPIAGPMPRAMAWLIDLMIRGVVYMIAAAILAIFDKVGMGLLLIITFFMEWLYPTLFEVLKGATPGKKSMNLHVCMDDGTALTWQAGLTRNLLRTIDFLPFFYAFGVVATLSNDRFKRLGDIVANTIVVYGHENIQGGVRQLKQNTSTIEAPTQPSPKTSKEPSSKADPSVDSNVQNNAQTKPNASQNLITPKPIPYPLNADEQRTILNFDDRLSDMTEARQQELANILTPIFNTKDEEAVLQLRQYAAWIRGGVK